MRLVVLREFFAERRESTASAASKRQADAPDTISAGEAIEPGSAAGQRRMNLLTCSRSRRGRLPRALRLAAKRLAAPASGADDAAALARQQRFAGDDEARLPPSTAAWGRAGHRHVRAAAGLA